MDPLRTGVLPLTFPTRFARLVACLSVMPIALASEAPAQAAPGGAVRGMVVESGSERPVAGATVSLVDVAGHPAGAGRTVTTDASGRYAFDRIPPGRFRIDISSLGFRSASVRIDLPAHWIVERSVGLAVEPIGLEPLEIAFDHGVPAVRAALVPDHPRMVPLSARLVSGAERVPYTLDTRVLDPGALPGGGAMGEPDVFRALQKLPGVSARGDYSATVWTRNAPWSMTQILLDGLPLFDPLHLGGITSGLAADGLASIGLMPGVRPPSHARGAAGTVILESAPAEARSGSAALSSLALRGQAEDRFLNDRVGLSVTARRSWWDVIRPPSFLTASETPEDVDYRFADVAGRLDVKAGAGILLEAGGLWEEDHLDGNVPDLISASSGRWGNRLGWVRASRRIGATRIEVMTGRVDYGVLTRPKPWASFVGPSGNPSLDVLVTELTHRTWSVSLAGRLRDGRLTWGAGMRGVEESLFQRGIEATERDLPGADEPIALDRQQAWVEATMELGPVDVAGGLGAEIVPDGVPVRKLVPSGRVRWTPVERLRLEVARGGATQYVYPLAPAEVSLGPGLAAGYLWVLAGEETPALSSRTTSAGASLLLPRSLELRVNAWWRAVDGLWMRDLPSLEPVAWTPEPGDAWGSERGSGLEVGLTWEGERAGADLSWSRGNSTFVHPSGSRWASPAERRNSVEAQFHAQAPGDLKTAINVVAESGWPFVFGPYEACAEGPSACIDPPEDVEPPTSHAVHSAPAFISVDLHVEWERQVGPARLGLSGSLRNALGRDNAAAWRAGTCGGRELITPVCEGAQGVGRFAPGLTRPTPSIAVRVRF